MQQEPSPTPDLVPELEECAREVQRQSEEVRTLVSSLEEAEFSWRPAPDRWSVGQNLTHLALTTRAYLESIDRAVEEARAEGHLGPGPYRHGWLGRWFIRILEPPPRLKVKTFSRLEPPAERDKEETVADFTASQNELLRSLEGASGVDLGRARIPSPFLGALKFSVGHAYRIILAHNRRHLFQIRTVLSHRDFPGR